VDHSRPVTGLIYLCINSLFSLSLQNTVFFIILTYLVHVLFTFYIQSVLKLKNNSGAKGLIYVRYPISIIN
jgi:hypothetical protein